MSRTQKEKEAAVKLRAGKRPWFLTLRMFVAIALLVLEVPIFFLVTGEYALIVAGAFFLPSCYLLHYVIVVEKNFQLERKIEENRKNE